METETFVRVAALRSSIFARGDELERLGQLPTDLLELLREAGCFRMFVPRSLGGDELPLPAGLEVIEEISHGDASVGWNVMIGSQTPLIISYLPQHAIEDIYSSTPDVIGGGTLAPKGRAQRDEGGYRFSGRWPFASGCQHCEYLMVHAMVADEGTTVDTVGARPVFRAALLPASEVSIVPNWDVMGLRGTGSHDLLLENAFVPEERTFTLFGGAPTLSDPLFRISPVGQLGLGIAAVALGIAAGALDDIVAIAEGGKRAAFARSSLAESPVFLDRLGEVDTQLRAARALLFGTAQDAWDKAIAERSFSLLDRGRLRSTTGYVVSLATAVVDTAYQLGGGSSLYSSSPLQRRFRDIHALTQHAAAGRDFFPLVGGLLVGQPVDEDRL